MKKKTLLYIAGGLLALYLLRLSYKKYKVDYEEATESDKKEILITQVIIKKKELDNPQNRAKYAPLSIEELEKMLAPEIPVSGPDNPSDTTGAGSW